MAEIACEGGLPISPAARFNPSCGAAQRTSSLGSDRQARRYRSSVRQPHRHFVTIDLDRSGVLVDERDCRQFTRARFKGCDNQPVLDIVAERIEADLAGREMNLRRPHQSRRIVDNADDLQRRGVLPAMLPHAERLERGGRSS